MGGMIIAAAQFTPVPGNIEANAARMASLVTEAAARGAGLVVFAELALTQYDLPAIAADPRLTVAPDDPRLEPVRQACRAAGVAAVVNAPGRAAADGAGPTIASFVLGPDGALLTRYDKRHLFGAEKDLFVPGTADGRFTLGGIRFALATCYDTGCAEVAARAAADGCRVFLASSFHGSADRVARYADLAAEHGLHVVLANGAGVGSAGRGCGLSGAWLPTGEREVAAGDGTRTAPDGGAELVLSDVRDRITLMADPAVAAIPVKECGEPLLDVRSAAPALVVSGLKAETDERAARVTRGTRRRRTVPTPGCARACCDGCWRPRRPCRTGCGCSSSRATGRRPCSATTSRSTPHELRAAHPGWDAARLHSAASRYVSPPDIAPHSAGGAVDVTLVTADGEEVDMGTPINASPEESAGACYTGAPGLSPAARANRRVLSAALAAAGLVNYPTEWWHWSYGDRYWALMTGAGHALYGPKEPA